MGQIIIILILLKLEWVKSDTICERLLLFATSVVQLANFDRRLGGGEGTHAGQGQ